jgi:hypothetical protein
MELYGNSLQINLTKNRRFLYSHKREGPPYATLYSYPIFKRSSEDLYPSNMYANIKTHQKSSVFLYPSIYPDKKLSKSVNSYTRPFANVLDSSFGSSPMKTFEKNQADFYGTTPANSTPFKALAKKIIS